MPKRNKIEKVPVVVYHLDSNYKSGVYKYQVFLGEYCRKDHIVKNISKDYECFDSEDEVNSYIKGLQKGGIVYDTKMGQ